MKILHPAWVNEGIQHITIWMMENLQLWYRTFVAVKKLQRRVTKCLHGWEVTSRGPNIEGKDLNGLEFPAKFNIVWH